MHWSPKSYTMPACMCKEAVNSAVFQRGCVLVSVSAAHPPLSSSNIGFTANFAHPSIMVHILA